MPICLSAATNDLTSTLQKGLFEEEANQNLEAAAQAYQSVSAQFDKDRQLAATAIFRLGEVYRKQGKTNDAVAQYERIVREFSDQQTLATLSRQNLGGLGIRGETAPTSQLSPAARSEQRRLLEEEIKLVEQDLAEIRQQIASGVAPQSAVRAKERELLQLRQRAVAIGEGTATAAANPADATAALTDDEEKEIRRIQAMIQNSPDLINASQPGQGTPLTRAAGNGHGRVAVFLLNNGAAVDQRTSDPAGAFPGGTALHYAALGGHRAMVDLLLQHGADANARIPQDGYTPLHVAANKGFQAVAEALLGGKADVNARSKTRQTPLHVSANFGHAALAATLIAKGAEIDAQDESGLTALALAALRGHLESVQALLKAGAQPNLESSQGRTPLSLAAESGHAEVVKALLAAKADPNAGKINLPLAMAVSRQRIETAEALLRAGADANLPGKTSRFFGAPGQNYPGVQGNEYGPYTPLQIAVAQKDAAMVKLLLQYKADPNTKDHWWTPPNPLSYWALNNGEMLQAFLIAGADANARGHLDMPLLVQASSSGDAAAVALLLAHGAKTDALDQAQRTALSYAAERSCLKCAEMLLAANADVNAAPLQGITPLHWAVSNGAKEMVEALLARGAAINAQTETGDAPLHWAIRIGDRGLGSAKMVELLLAKGANPNLRNRDDQTPLDLVKQPGSSAMLPGRIARPPLPQPSVPIPGLPSGTPVAGGASQVAESTPPDLASLLRRHGARDDLPRLDRIEVRRPVANYSATVFWKPKQDWNQHTLLELFAVEYGLLAIQREVTQYAYTETNQFRPWPVKNERRRVTALQFPDFKNVLIRRPTADGLTREDVKVDLAALLQSGDCARDIPLHWGDVVEIAESDHRIDEQWTFPAEALKTLKECLTRKVTISVKDQTMSFTLAPAMTLEGGALKLMASNRRFGLMPVLEESKLLRNSSDLSRIKVTRRDAATGQTREWIVDRDVTPDLWLRDGDVVDVPDKP